MSYVNSPAALAGAVLLLLLVLDLEFAEVQRDVLGEAVFAAAAAGAHRGDQDRIEAKS